MKKKFYSNGKLLITGEYLVLDGAKALAVPTVYGQHLKVKTHDNKLVFWKSLDADKNCWFEAVFKVKQNNLFLVSDRNTISETLHNMLLEAGKLNPEFLSQLKGTSITTKLTFDRNWGLGSSSTLINNIAQWATIDAYSLLQNSFGGSGYDIACAQHNTPIIFSNAPKPHAEPVTLNWDFKDQLFFVYLNQKQDSKKSIAHYQGKKLHNSEAITKINQLTEAIVKSDTLQVFENLIVEHEAVLADVLQLEPVKKRLFPDFKGAVKSLGGWGGDFVLVTGDAMTPIYFSQKGYEVCIPFGEMVLK